MKLWMFVGVCIRWVTFFGQTQLPGRGSNSMVSAPWEDACRLEDSDDGNWIEEWKHFSIPTRIHAVVVLAWNSLKSNRSSVWVSERYVHNWCRILLCSHPAPQASSSFIQILCHRPWAWPWKLATLEIVCIFYVVCTHIFGYISIRHTYNYHIMYHNII